MKLPRKKLTVFALTAAVVLLDAWLDLGLEETRRRELVALGVALLGAQGLADFGKGRSEVEKGVDKS